jgi:hypothetical protein
MPARRPQVSLLNRPPRVQFGASLAAEADPVTAPAQAPPPTSQRRLGRLQLNLYIR